MTVNVFMIGNTINNFNSHARVGRDDIRTEHAISHFDFNSHARVGRDFLTFRFALLCFISTHTPAWGVTQPPLVLPKI